MISNVILMTAPCENDVKRKVTSEPVHVLAIK